LAAVQNYPFWVVLVVLEVRSHLAVEHPCLVVLEVHSHLDGEHPYLAVLEVHSHLDGERPYLGVLEDSHLAGFGYSPVEEGMAAGSHLEVALVAHNCFPKEHKYCFDVGVYNQPLAAVEDRMDKGVADEAKAPHAEVAEPANHLLGKGSLGK
jgi:hypothetical protein